MMWKIKSPNPEYTGESAGVAFAAGEGKTDNAAAAQWLEAHGYEVEQDEAVPPKVEDEPPKTDDAPPKAQKARGSKKDEAQAGGV